MGGLRNHIHGTYETMLLATIAIAGIPPFAGFWSKDDILGAAFKSGGISCCGGSWGCVGAFMTVFLYVSPHLSDVLRRERFDTQHGIRTNRHRRCSRR